MIIIDSLLLSDLEISENMPYLILTVQRKNIYIHIKYIYNYSIHYIYIKKRKNGKK